MQTLDQISRALQTGAVTSLALIEPCLARIADPAGEGSRAFLKIYAEQARESADAIDRLRRAGRAPGRYAGIPISVKDLFDIAGEPTPAGSVVLRDAAPAASHATIVRRLLQAGLIPVGRTNMTEFAFSGVGINPHFGTPLSPWDRATGRIPGGSSSGAAVSVADGMAAAAIGTDTGGSCRIPAAFCGIVGYKPTAARVPRDGVLPLAPSLDSVGPLAASAACCATLDAIMAGEPDRVLAPVHIAGLRLLLPTNVMLDGMDKATEKSFDHAIDRLDRHGVLIDRRHLHCQDMMAAANARGGFAVVEAYAWHRDLLARDADRYDPRVASRILPGADMSGADYVALLQTRPRVITAFERELAPYDAMIMPTVPIAPPPIAAFASEAEYWRLNYLILRNPSAINFLDGCAISLPCHEQGAPPAGLMLAAGTMEDARLLAIAQAVETALA